MKASLTKPEWAVMNALWEDSPLAISGIIAGMGDEFDWKYNTYATYVNRLVEKGCLGFEKLGRDKLYYPLVQREDCIVAESKNILEKFDEHMQKELLVCMLKDSGLSAGDRRELKELLEGMLKEEQ